MANIVDYARQARESFAERPFGRVDSLCLSCLAYLREVPGLPLDTRAGVRLADLADPVFMRSLTSGLHGMAQAPALLAAMAASPRFANVRACLHASESSEAEGVQFSATTYVLPDVGQACVAFRGTDDTTLGWKENIRLACGDAVPAQRRAARYLEEVAEELGCGLYVSGHSKGGVLAEYACEAAPEALRSQLAGCFSHDGPALVPELRGVEYRTAVPFDKTVPRESLVGMLFERSQDGLVVVRSSQAGVWQHEPFSWEVCDNDFVPERGLALDAWRLSQRLNDWLEDMGPQTRASFAELLCWLVDATGETSFSALLGRWSSNTQAMRAALAAAPRQDQALFERALDDLSTTLLLGSRQEHGIGVDDTPRGTSRAAARRIEDLSAQANDHLARIDRLVNGR